MKRKYSVLVILLLSVMIVSLPGISEALLVAPADYTGYRTADPGDPHYGIFGTDGWGDAAGGYFEISWIIDYDLSHPKPYMYEYTFDIPDVGGGLSHFIIEVSEDTTRDDFSPDPGDELKVHKKNQGNPGLPEHLFGIKTNTSGQTSIQSYTIFSDRAPMWGDLYAKDGRQAGTDIEIYAYNLGFGVEPASGNSPFNYWIPVPDTQTSIPEPATILLIGSLMIGIGCLGRKKNY